MGATWSAFNTGFSNPLITKVRALLTSATGATVFAGTDLGVFKSTGGAWQPIAQGPEDDPAHARKLNQSVQSLVSLTGGPMLAGVFSGGVYKTGDGGATWSPKNAKRRTCTFQKLVTTLRRTGLAAGNASVKFSGKVGGSKLSPGTYTATFVATDRAGNVSKASSLVFEIVRR